MTNKRPTIHDLYTHCEGDMKPELFEFAHQHPLGAFWLWRHQMTGAEISVGGARCQHVPDGDEDRMTDSHHGLLPPFGLREGKATELALQVRPPGPAGCPARLTQGGPQPPVALAGPPGPSFARRRNCEGSSER